MLKATMIPRKRHRVEEALGLKGDVVYSLQWQCEECGTRSMRTVDWQGPDISPGDRVLVDTQCSSPECMGRKYKAVAEVVDSESRDA